MKSENSGTSSFSLHSSNFDHLFPDSFEHQNGEVIPTSWSFASLTDVYDVHSGLSKPRSEFGFGHAFLSFKDVMDNPFVPHTLHALFNSNEKERQSCSVMRGDVFLTRTSETQEDLGMSSVALKDYPNATFNGFTKRLRPKVDSFVSPEFAACYFRSPRFRRDVTAMSSLSTRASLNNGMLGSLTMLVPTQEVCIAFAGHVALMADRIHGNNRESETLATLRDTLLPRLLSGELRVADAERSLKGASL